MRDPIQTDNDLRYAQQSHGIAFGVGELLLMRSWCEFHDVPFVVRLDHGFQRDDYEEVIEFPTEAGAIAGLIIWRQPDAIIVLPEAGTRRRHGTMEEALHGLSTQPHIVLTDIAATTWPVG